MSTTTAAIYTRISQDATAQQLGVTRQLDDCRALAKRLRRKVVAHFDDNDLSAFTGKTRPGFEAMLVAMARAEFGALICWHPDRLYRSMKDLERLIEIADAAHIQIRSVNGGDLDLSNSTGRMLARIVGSVARQESEHKGERQRRANRQHREAGKWLSAGQRPFGYSKDGLPLEPEASMVRQAAVDVLAGHSLRAIATEWNSRGIFTTHNNKWTNLTLRRILSNPLYAGLVVYQGRVIGPGEWQPLFDLDTHRGLVALLSDPSRRASLSFARKHLLSGIARCGICGEPLYIMYPHRDRPSYCCRLNVHVARSAPLLDGYIEALVLEYLDRQDLGAGLRQHSAHVDVAKLHTARAALAARLDELAGMFAAGEITGSQMRRGSADLRTEMSAIDSSLADAAAVSPLAALATADEDTTLADRWKAASMDIKGRIVDELMVVTVHKGRPGMRTFDPDLIEIEWR
jgi:site-specific DNA recombinase